MKEEARDSLEIKEEARKELGEGGGEGRARRKRRRRKS